MYDAGPLTPRELRPARPEPCSARSYPPAGWRTEEYNRASESLRLRRLGVYAVSRTAAISTAKSMRSAAAPRASEHVVAMIVPGGGHTVMPGRGSFGGSWGGQAAGCWPAPQTSLCASSAMESVDQPDGPSRHSGNTIVWYHYTPRSGSRTGSTCGTSSEPSGTP